MSCLSLLRGVDSSMHHPMGFLDISIDDTPPMFIDKAPWLVP
jgi:hypothetical protein